MASSYSCEGHDKTVTYSIYDLFLCPSCADIRGAEQAQKHDTVTSGTRTTSASGTSNKSNAKAVKPPEIGKTSIKEATANQTQPTRTTYLSSAHHA